MMLWPSADDERAIALNARLKKPALPAAWRANRPLPQIVFFVLTCVGVAALSGFIAVIGLPLTVAGIIAIGVAEVLLQRWRWWRTGVEGALWAGGLMAIVIDIAPDTTRGWMLAFAVAAAIAWVRVRYAIFAGVAIALLVFAIDDGGNPAVAAAFAALVIVIALAGIAHTWRRPSSEWLFIALLLVTPLAAFIAARQWAIAFYLPFAIVCIAIGIRLRHHAPLLASMIGIVILALELRESLPLANELQLTLGGALLLGTAWLLARTLREKTTGIVVTKESLTDADELLESAVVVTTAPQPTPAVETGRVQGDGSFGGAGATGDY